VGLLELIILIIIVMWLLGFGFHVGGSLIHALLVVALVIIVIRALQGRTPIP